jgi:hypothetical protein
MSVSPWLRLSRSPQRCRIAGRQSAGWPGLTERCFWLRFRACKRFGERGFHLRKRSDPWDRTCPDCDATFASVQSMGVCPSCGLMFHADENGEVIRKGRHVGDPMPPPPTPEESAVRSISKYVRLLNAGIISIDEFRYNVLLCFAHMPERCWLASADVMPPDIAADFRSYLADYLTPVDFMPSPTPFMVDTRFEAAIAQKKRELRPKYLALHQFWQSRG